VKRRGATTSTVDEGWRAGEEVVDDRGIGMKEADVRRMNEIAKVNDYSKLPYGAEWTKGRG
jgi:hypothetical protein